MRVEDCLPKGVTLRSHAGYAVRPEHVTSVQAVHPGVVEIHEMSGRRERLLLKCADPSRDYERETAEKLECAFCLGRFR